MGGCGGLSDRMANPFQSRTFTRQRRERWLTEDERGREPTGGRPVASILNLFWSLTSPCWWGSFFFFCRPQHQTGSSQRWHSAISHPSSHHTLQHTAQSRDSGNPPPHRPQQPYGNFQKLLVAGPMMGILTRPFFSFGNIQIAVFNRVLDCENMIRQL